MKKATDALLADHKMIRKLLSEYHVDNPRFVQIDKTLRRVILSHAWFEDTVFLPAFLAEPLFVKSYLDELYAEHTHIEQLSTLLQATAPRANGGVYAAYLAQFRAILDNHLKKEEDALFPLAEKILDNEGLNRLGAEMERRQDEARRLFSV